MTTRTRTDKKVARFVRRELLDNVPSHVDPLASGMLDSLALEALVFWLEEEFAMSFRDEDMVAENFASLATLSAFVERRREEAASGRRSEA